MVTTDTLVEEINFWIEQLDDNERLNFLEWMSAHARALGAPSGVVGGDRLNGIFRNWLNDLPEESRRAECLIVLGEICWQGLRRTLP